MKDTLLISFGNTNITLALAGEYGAENLKKFKLQDTISVKKYLSRLDLIRAFVVSVVPKREKTVLGLLSGVKIFKAGVDLKIPIVTNYDSRSSLGLDRLINAYYVKEKIGCPAVCIDCGTAVTIDLISAQGAFEGGLIIPGFNTASKALADNTDRLREVSFKALPNHFYGQNTRDCIKLGITLSISSLIEQVIKKYNKQIKGKAYLVITGGDAELVLNGSTFNFIYLPNITIDSLWLFYAKKFL